MNELNMGVLSIAPLVVSLIVLVIGLFLWFFVNRVSNRTNEQIALLEELVALQKRQNELLRRLCESNEPEPRAVPKQGENERDDFADFVPER